MSNDIVPAKRSALAQLAAISGMAPPDNANGAVRHAIAFLAGVYGSRFQPSANAVPAWLVALGDATPDEIAEAALAHARDTSRDGDGKMRGEFPPSAVELLERIRHRRATAREWANAQNVDAELCKRWARDPTEGWEEARMRVRVNGSRMSAEEFNRCVAFGERQLAKEGS